MARSPETRPADLAENDAPATGLSPTAPVETPPPAPPVETAPPVEASAAAISVYLTVGHSDRYGPGGRFLDLTPDEARPGLDADPAELVTPTAEQLSRRRA